MLTKEQQFLEQINKANSILITTSKGRANNLADALGLFLFLEKHGKRAEILSEKSHAHKNVSFLPKFDEIKEESGGLQNFIISLNTSQAEVKQIKYFKDSGKVDFIVTPKKGNFSADDIKSYLDGFRHDLIITLGTQDMDSLGNIYSDNPEFFYQMPIINIDNHSANEEYGQLNIVDLSAAAVSEILFSLFQSANKEAMNEEIATCLLAGMILGTKNFKTPTITPRTFQHSAELISLGARREEIIKHLYQSRHLNVLQLWGRMLARLSGSLNHSLVWSALSWSDFEKTGTTPEDIEEIIEELIVNIPQVKVIIITYENKEGEKTSVEGLVHSVKNFDARSLAKEFNPTGDARQVRIKLESSLAKSGESIATIIENKIKDALAG